MGTAKPEVHLMLMRAAEAGEIEVLVQMHADPTRNERDPKHKTQLCKYYPNCMNGANCSFAHGTDDLRKFKPPK